MKEQISGLRNESSKTKRIGLFQRITAAFLLPLIIIYKKVSSTFLLNLSVFWHINEGIEEIMADYVHQEMTRNLILVYLRLFLLIVIKDVFLSLVSFLNKSKNLMDRTHPWLLRKIDIGFAFRKEPSVLFLVGGKSSFFNKGLGTLVLPFVSFTARPSSLGGIFDSWPGIKAQHKSIRSERQAPSSKPTCTRG